MGNYFFVHSDDNCLLPDYLYKGAIYYKFNGDQYKAVAKPEKAKTYPLVIVSKNKFIVTVIYCRKYEAPILLSKNDKYFRKIIKSAKEKEIPVIHNKDLAENIYHNTDENDYIPFDTWNDVAKLLIEKHDFGDSFD